MRNFLSRNLFRFSWNIILALGQGTKLGCKELAMLLVLQVLLGYGTVFPLTSGGPYPCFLLSQYKKRIGDESQNA